MKANQIQRINQRLNYKLSLATTMLAFLALAANTAQAQQWQTNRNGSKMRENSSEFRSTGNGQGANGDQDWEYQQQIDESTPEQARGAGASGNKQAQTVAEDPMTTKFRGQVRRIPFVKYIGRESKQVGMGYDTHEQQVSIISEDLVSLFDRYVKPFVWMIEDTRMSISANQQAAFELMKKNPVVMIVVMLESEALRSQSAYGSSTLTAQQGRYVLADLAMIKSQQPALYQFVKKEVIPRIARVYSRDRFYFRDRMTQQLTSPGIDSQSYFSLRDYAPQIVQGAKGILLK